MNKLQSAVSRQNSKYFRDGKVSLDEFYLGGISYRVGKQGRGADQATVMIRVSLTNGAPKHCFIEIIDHTTTGTVFDTLKRQVQLEITLKTDGNPTYRACAREMGFTYTVTLSSDQSAHKVFSWVNPQVSSTRRFFDDIYHERKECKQLYLKERVY